MRRWLLLTAALSLAIVWGLGFAAARVFAPVSKSGSDRPEITEAAEAPVSNDERSNDEQIAGHGVLRRVVGVDWAGHTRRREGDVLPAGPLAFESGLVELDLFCGASLVVEGPAALDLVSDWVVAMQSGRVRASVPPAARGFVVRAGDAEVFDLGTEFAMEVSADLARVEVIDGEVELRGGLQDGIRLTQGESASLLGTPSAGKSLASIATASDLDSQRDEALSRSIADWQHSVTERATDPRLIAFFAGLDQERSREITNFAASDSPSPARLIGLVGREAGRFGQPAAGLNFSRPGSRARVLLEGSFEALTFTCWVQINGLDHRYNALFMGDGYENGEPHWQIRDDGRLMFSVMVDDSEVVEVVSPVTGAIVRDAGRHRVYFTEPFWDITRSGQWFHLAAVYDPRARRVRQFINGEQVANEPIVANYFIDQLRIGPGEIGNWGQPFRESPWFAVRNLNGTIDELAIYNAALTANEIAALYGQGKPLGY